jgi:hypothetical protein
LRGPGKECVLVYDHVGDSGAFHVDRKSDENGEAYNRRSGLYDSLFGRRD